MTQCGDFESRSMNVQPKAMCAIRLNHFLPAWQWWASLFGRQHSMPTTTKAWLTVHQHFAIIASLDIAQVGYMRFCRWRFHLGRENHANFWKRLSHSATLALTKTNLRGTMDGSWTSPCHRWRRRAFRSHRGQSCSDCHETCYSRFAPNPTYLNQNSYRRGSRLQRVSQSAGGTVDELIECVFSIWPMRGVLIIDRYVSAAVCNPSWWRTFMFNFFYATPLVKPGETRRSSRVKSDTYRIQGPRTGPHVSWSSPWPSLSSSPWGVFFVRLITGQHPNLSQNPSSMTNWFFVRETLQVKGNI